jgi:hypothetical protein
MTTSNGRISRAPKRMALWEPNQPPAIAPSAMHRPSSHSIFPPSAKNRTLATLLVKFRSLVSAVARVSPSPRSATRLVEHKVPVPGPKEAVVEPDEPADRSVAALAQPVVRVLVGHSGAEQHVERHGDQQRRDHQGQRCRIDCLNEQNARGRTGEDQRDRQLVLAPAHQASPGVIARGHGRPEHRLQLVGRERLDRRRAGEQQSRQHDQPAAARNRIDEAGEDGGRGQRRIDPWIEHWRRIDRWRRLSPSPTSELMLVNSGRQQVE